MLACPASLLLLLRAAMLRLLGGVRRFVVELDDDGVMLAIKPENLRPL